MRPIGYLFIGAAIRIAIDPFWRALLVAVLIGAGLSLILEAHRQGR